MTKSYASKSLSVRTDAGISVWIRFTICRYICAGSVPNGKDAKRDAAPLHSLVAFVYHSPKRFPQRKQWHGQFLILCYPLAQDPRMVDSDDRGWCMTIVSAQRITPSLTLACLHNQHMRWGICTAVRQTHTTLHSTKQ